MKTYRLLTAWKCVAEISADNGAVWFGPYLPASFVLGDPAARDAALHAVQACIPHRRLLPTGIDRLTIHRAETGLRLVRAQERQREQNNFVYDVDVTDAHGELIEQWEGLRLRAMEELAARDPWPHSLLAPYLERRLEELAPQAWVQIALEYNGLPDRGSPDFHQARSSATNHALHRALGRPEQIWRRADGKPVSGAAESFSAAHAHGLTLAVAAYTGVACDLEAIAPRTLADWQDLLGQQRLKLAGRIAQEQTEPTDVAATRLWCALECMKKAGLSAEGPLVLDSSHPDGWVLLRAGAMIIATYPAPVRELKSALMFAVATKARPVTAELAGRQILAIVPPRKAMAQPSAPNSE